MWRDSETEIDYLNFEYLVTLLTELIWEIQSYKNGCAKFVKDFSS